MFGHDNNNRDEEVVKSDDTTKADDTSIKPTDDAASSHTDDDDNDGIGGFEATPAATPVKPVVPDLPDTPVAHHSKADADDLLAIKQEALHALTPLVGQLDQTPEEQFRTTMMMIQASDDHSLVKVAYEAAKKISNEKERAQALLDIVNEINYFTQNTSQA